MAAISGGTAGSIPRDLSLLGSAPFSITIEAETLSTPVLGLARFFSPANPLKEKPVDTPADPHAWLDKYIAEQAAYYGMTIAAYAKAVSSLADAQECVEREGEPAR